MIGRLLTVKDLAAVLNVPTSWVYERTRKGGRELIPHTRVGKYVRFSEDQVQEFLQKH